MSMQEAHISLFMWQTPNLPVGLLILLAFLLGALLLYAVSVLSALHDKGEIKKLKKRVAELESQSAQPIQTVPAQGISPIMPMPGMHGPPQI
jgi:hypothetical protein